MNNCSVGKDGDEIDNYRWVCPNQQLFCDPQTEAVQFKMDNAPLSRIQNSVIQIMMVLGMLAMTMMTATVFWMTQTTVSDMETEQVMRMAMGLAIGAIGAQSCVCNKSRH